MIYFVKTILGAKRCIYKGDTYPKPLTIPCTNTYQIDEPVAFVKTIEIKCAESNTITNVDVFKSASLMLIKKRIIA